MRDKVRLLLTALILASVGMFTGTVVAFSTTGNVTVQAGSTNAYTLPDTKPSKAGLGIVFEDLTDSVTQTHAMGTVWKEFSNATVVNTVFYENVVIDLSNGSNSPGYFVSADTALNESGEVSGLECSLSSETSLQCVNSGASEMTIETCMSLEVNLGTSYGTGYNISATTYDSSNTVVSISYLYEFTFLGIGDQTIIYVCAISNVASNHYVRYAEETLKPTTIVTGPNQITIERIN